MTSLELSKSRCLISGTSSGIGKFLIEKLPLAESYDRSASFKKYEKKNYDVIIHCAYDASITTGHKEIYEQSKSNISLVEKLCGINCGIFIFFSSIDVYPKELNIKSSDFKLGAGENFTRHAHFKIIGESIVASKKKKYLILRPSLMIGKNSRLNTFLNIIKGKKGPFTLAKNSRFNLITHDQILFCLQAALLKGMEGTINLCSGLEISLDEVAHHVENDNISWGQFEYKTPKLENSNMVQFFGGKDNTIDELISKVLNWQ